jgi:hypothetical protein
LRAGNPDAICKMRLSRDAAHPEGVLAHLDTRLPTVRRMRPEQPWSDVVQVLNRGQAATWTVEWLRRTVRRLADEGIAWFGWSGIKAAALDRTLSIAAQLQAMRERTPRGGTRWHPSSVKHLWLGPSV